MSFVYSCDLDNETQYQLKLHLFKNVKNTNLVRKNIVKGLWKCAALKPSLVLDPFQVAVAANRAAIAQMDNSMVTKTIYGELLFNLSLSKNISDSLKKFGADDNDETLLLCFLLKEEDKDNMTSIVEAVEGEACSISEMKNYTNIAEIKTTYKLNTLNSDEHLLDNIVSRIVTKSFVTFSK